METTLTLWNEKRDSDILRVIRYGVTRHDLCRRFMTAHRAYRAALAAESDGLKKTKKHGKLDWEELCEQAEIDLDELVEVVRVLAEELNRVETSFHLALNSTRILRKLTEAALQPENHSARKLFLEVAGIAQAKNGLVHIHQQFTEHQRDDEREEKAVGAGGSQQLPPPRSLADIEQRLLHAKRVVRDKENAGEENDDPS